MRIILQRQGKFDQNARVTRTSICSICVLRYELSMVVAVTEERQTKFDLFK